MNGTTMMRIFGGVAVVCFLLVPVILLLLFIAPFGGFNAEAQTCDAGPVVVDTEANNHGGKDVKAFELPHPDGAGVEQENAGPIPADYLKAYKAAGEKYGLPWELLAGVGMAESGHHSDSTSGAGAQGPMQFMPATWSDYAEDGNHDGKANVWDIGDAAFAAAHYLVDLGVKNGPDGVFAALGKYNNSYPKHTYGNDVLRYAWQYATGKIKVTESGGDGQCSAIGASGLGAAIIANAARWLGTPYQYAGGDVSGCPNDKARCGPTVGVNSRGDGKLGFDCSGLTMYAVYMATNGKVALAHNVAVQYNDHRIQHVGINALQPGDLVFLDDLDHIGIYVGNQRIIDAPHTGAYVRYDSLAPGSTFYHNFVSGGRVMLGSNQQ